MSSKKKSTKVEKILVMKDGREFKIVGEKGLFILCEGTAFKKNNPNILEVKKDKTEENKEEE